MSIDTPPADRLEHIANQITDVANTASRSVNGAASDSYVAYRRLADLGHELAEHPEAFLGVNLLATYPPEAMLPDRQPSQKASRRIRIITAVRDVMVFAPIGFTWYELHNALDHYHDTGTQFIADWAKGFPVHGTPTVRTLGSTAFWVTVFIFIIVLLTASLHAFEARLENNCSLASERRDLGTLLGAATMELRRFSSGVGLLSRPINLEQIGRDFGASTLRLESSIQQLGGDIRESFGGGPESMFSKALEQWVAAVASLAKLGESLAVPAEALQEFLDAQQAITDAQDRQAQTIQQLISQIQDATRASAQSAHLGRGVLTEVTEVTRGLGSTLDFFENRVRTLDDVLSQLRYLLRGQANGSGGAIFDDDDNPVPG